MVDRKKRTGRNYCWRHNGWWVEPLRVAQWIVWNKLLAPPQCLLHKWLLFLAIFPLFINNNPQFTFFFFNLPLLSFLAVFPLFIKNNPQFTFLFSLSFLSFHLSSHLSVFSLSSTPFPSPFHFSSLFPTHNKSSFSFFFPYFSSPSFICLLFLTPFSNDSFSFTFSFLFPYSKPPINLVSIPFFSYFSSPSFIRLPPHSFFLRLLFLHLFFSPFFPTHDKSNFPSFFSLTFLSLFNLPSFPHFLFLRLLFLPSSPLFSSSTMLLPFLSLCF